VTPPVPYSKVEGVTSHPNRAIAAVAHCILTANSALLVKLVIEFSIAIDELVCEFSELEL
jgi:hypothetical protein